MKDYQAGYIKIALPKGRFLSPTASLLAEIDLGFQDYSDKTKQYRLRSARFPGLSAKILQEKDISIQVAVGNYDLGICGLDWIEEFLVKYPAGALVKISSLNYGDGDIHVVASAESGIANLNDLSDGKNDYRIVSEYPNLAEAFALNLRMRRFRIFPVWGAAEAYPPENADLAVLWGKSGADIETQGLIPLKRLLPVTAFLIANRESLENKDLSQILTCFNSKLTAEPQTSREAKPLKQRPLPEVLQLIPEAMARRFNAVPVAITDNAFQVAMANPADIFALEALAAQSRMRIKPVAATAEEISDAIDFNYKAFGEIEEQVSRISIPTEETDEKVALRAATDTPLVQALNLIIEEAIKARASDIHIEPQEDRVRIRYRIDGTLQDTMSLPMSVHRALISRIKILAELNIADHFRPQDGQFSIKSAGRPIDIRVATSPTVRGETAVLRFLDKSKVHRPLRQANEINLALPDGHQQAPTSQLLKQAGLTIQGYYEDVVSRRPFTDLDWLGIKVIRPQDMPLQVANSNFDLAITGEDWLQEHLYRFPSSPVKKLFALGFGTVKIAAAVSQEMPVADVDGLRSLVQSSKFAPLKVASEYINIADKYLRDNHINPYKLIPTWGASEAFLPEDADMLIDNVQTGKTLKQHKLKIIDVLFRSSACLIANKDSLASSDKKEKMELLAQKLRAGLK